MQLEGQLSGRNSLQMILRFLQLNLFERRDLLELLRGDPPEPRISSSQTALAFSSKFIGQQCSIVIEAHNGSDTVRARDALQRCASILLRFFANASTPYGAHR